MYAVVTWDVWMNLMKVIVEFKLLVLAIIEFLIYELEDSVESQNANMENGCALSTKVPMFLNSQSLSILLSSYAIMELRLTMYRIS